MTLSQDEIKRRLRDLSNGWTLDGSAIRKQFTFAGFPEAVRFVARLVPAAEAADHHPDIQINYKRVTLTYSTHSEGGLTEKDFAWGGRRRHHAGLMRLKQTYSSREVAALTGLTARQLQLWDASGLVSSAIPPRRTLAGGYTERRYTPIDLLEMLVLADLKKRGLSSHQLLEIRDALKVHFNTRLFEATGGGGSVQLLTNGQEVYARTADQQFYNLLKAPTQPLLAVGDAALLKELGAKIRGEKRTKKARRPASE